MEEFDICCINIFNYIENNIDINLEFINLNPLLVKNNFAEVLYTLMNKSIKILFDNYNYKYIYNYNNNFIYIHFYENDNKIIKFYLKNFSNFRDVYNYYYDNKQ